MTPTHPFHHIAGLSELSRTLEQLFPPLSFQFEAAKILILSEQSRLVNRFLTSIDLAHQQSLTASGIMFQRTEKGLPVLQGAYAAIDSLWYLCASDHYDFRGEAFTHWADANRRVLGRLPIFGICLFEETELPRWSEPIIVEHEQIAGRDLMVLSMALNKERTSFGQGSLLSNLQFGLLTRLLLQGLKHRLGYRPWAHFVQRWDDAVAGAIDNLLDPLHKGEIKGSNHLDTALLTLRHFKAAHTVIGHAASHMGQAFDLAHALDDAYAQAREIQNLAREVAGLMNDVRDIRAAGANEQEYMAKTFGHDFQRYRFRILRLADHLITNFTARGLTDEAKLFIQAKADLADDIRVILLGPFSSGKSTFLNTLLGLTEENNALPTSGKPETATINVLEYAEVDEVRFKFAEVADLPLFEKSLNLKARWKVNGYEIGAFLMWLSNNAIDLAALESFRFLKTGGMRSSPKNEVYTEKDHYFLNELLKKKNQFVDEQDLSGREAIIKLANIRFSRRPVLPDPKDVKACLEIVKEPYIALQAEELTIRRTLAALQGLRFVDTPGTDSLISHHHTLARRYIERYSESPIVYFLNGPQAATEEDAKNIEFLKSLKADSERFFFVITKKQKSVETQDDEFEIRSAVKRRLRDAQMGDKRVYFIDSLMARQDRQEPEWRALEEDLRTFVNNSRTKLLRALARKKIKQALEDLRSDYQTLLKGLRSDHAHRGKQAALWTQTADEIGAILKNFAKEVRVTQERIFRGRSGTFEDEIKYIESQLFGFDCKAYRTSKKDSKLGEIRALLDPLTAWPDTLKKNLESAERLLHTYLESELTTRAATLKPNLSRESLPPEFQTLELSDINSKAREDIFYAVKTYTGWLESKVSRIRELLKRERKDAEDRIEKEFAKIVRSYTSQCQTLKSRAEEFARSILDTSNLADSIQKTEANIRFIEASLKEFAAIV